MSLKLKAEDPPQFHDGIQQNGDDVPDVVMPLPLRPWQLTIERAVRLAKAGMLLGAVAGCTSLVFNVIGSVLWPAITGQPQHPLRLIQVYLTFPLGEYALQLHSGALLALGCLLYLGTGMLYGMVFELVLGGFLPRARVGARLLACSILALAVWLLNFYALLVWLQPLLLGGRWIIDLVPWWVAALTHLVFGWTMALVVPWGIHGWPEQQRGGSPIGRRPQGEPSHERQENPVSD